jgi:hypothetical protein
VALTAEEQSALLIQLQAIKAKNATRAVELGRIAADALRELLVIEDRMDDEARALSPEYMRLLMNTDFKLTYQTMYAQWAEESDETIPMLEDALSVVDNVMADAGAAAAAVVVLDDDVVAAAEAAGEARKTVFEAEAEAATD